MKRFPLGLLLAAGSAFALPDFAAATPISASMSLQADVTVGDVSDSQPSSSSWGTLLNPLSINASATVPVPETNAGATVSGQGSAAWGAGGNSGSVTFRNYGWDSTTGGTDLLTNLSLNNSGPDWSYTFLADATGTFTMSFAVVGTGDTFGLQGWNIDWTGAGGGLTLNDASDPTTSGTFSRSIVAGETYTISLQNNANVSADSGFDASGSMNGEFDWSIQQSSNVVPEPGTLAILSLGLAGLAASRRRKR